jgi:hypothetical protein
MKILINNVKANELFPTTKYLVANDITKIKVNDGQTQEFMTRIVLDLNEIRYEIHKCDCCDKKYMVFVNLNGVGEYTFDLLDLVQFENGNALCEYLNIQGK